jgi:hypothetical protein
MKPVPLQPNLPTPTTAFGNPAPIAQYYICPHCKEQSPLVREWVGLTAEQISSIWDDHVVPVFGKNGINPIVFAKAIEVKLKEKNHG